MEPNMGPLLGLASFAPQQNGETGPLGRKWLHVLLLLFSTPLVFYCVTSHHCLIRPTQDGLWVG